MCLILFAYKRHPQYALILAANRDEFYARPTEPLAYWQDHPKILAGRDLQAMGTWMGITKGGRLAAVTNYREPGIHKHDALSRGALVYEFLNGTLSPADYLKTVEAQADQYNGFNLLVGDPTELRYYSNRSRKPSNLAPGIYGLSNHLLDTGWPKILRGKKQLATLIEKGGAINPEKTYRLLTDQKVAPTDQLPDTGVGLEWETILAPIFISSPTYGTRSSSILLIDYSGHILLSERTWQPNSTEPMLLDEKTFTLTLPESMRANPSTDKPQLQ